jgi:hypothetical protein
MSMRRLDIRSARPEAPLKPSMKTGKTPDFTGVFHIFHMLFHRRKFMQTSFDRFPFVDII